MQNPSRRKILKDTSVRAGLAGFSIIIGVSMLSSVVLAATTPPPPSPPKIISPSKPPPPPPPPRP